MDRTEGLIETSFEQLLVGDRFEIGGQCVMLVKLETNTYDELVLSLEIENSPDKEPLEPKLIIPRGLTCYILER